LPELTIVACPACGLPAELLTRLDSDLTPGDAPHLMIRCVDRHISTIPLTPPVEELQATVERSRPGRNVLPLQRRRRRVRAAVGRMARAVNVHLPHSWRPLWFGFGALVAVLLLRAPIAALILVPLSIPVAGIAAARRSWRPLFPVAPPAPAPEPEPASEDDEGLAAA
jgi:hypothetical protein